MSTDDDRIAGWVDALLDRTRDRLRGELKELVSRLTEEMAARQADAAREAEAAGAALASEALRAEREAAEARLASAVAAARAEAAAEHERALADLRAGQDQAGSGVPEAQALEREATLASASELLEVTRALDEASSVSAVLDELARGAARFTSRAAVLLCRDGRVHGWTWHGFETAAGSPRNYTASFAEAGVAGLAAAAGETRTGGHGDAGGVLRLSRPDRVALAVPLRAGGDVVAVLYADNEGERAEAGGPDAPVVPSAWPELIETLARHAGRCLESAIARGLPELVRAGATERARRRTLTSDDEAAERYARLLVAEIKLYHEALVDEARRERNLLRRLRPQIERAQQLYEERVAPAVRARTKYFEQELVRTLAGGDPSLLGQPT